MQELTKTEKLILEAIRERQRKLWRIITDVVWQKNRQFGNKCN